MFSGVLESFTSLMSARSENKTLKKLHIFIIFNKNNLSENSRSSQNLLLDKFHLIVGNYPKLPPRMPTKCQLRAKGSWVSFQTQLRAKSQTQLCTINSIFPSSWHFQLPQPTQTQLSTTIISNSGYCHHSLLYTFNLSPNVKYKQILFVLKYEIVQIIFNICYHVNLFRVSIPFRTKLSYNT